MSQALISQEVLNTILPKIKASVEREARREGIVGPVAQEVKTDLNVVLDKLLENIKLY